MIWVENKQIAATDQGRCLPFLGDEVDYGILRVSEREDVLTWIVCMYISPDRYRHGKPPCYRLLGEDLHGHGTCWSKSTIN